MPEPNTVRRALVILFSTSLLNSIGFGIIIPVMPQLIMEVAGKDLATAALYSGWLTFTYSLMQFLFAPVTGNLSDRFGRRTVLMICLVGFSANYVVMGYAPTLTWLFASRILAGIAASTNTITNAVVADISPPEERPQNFALLGAAFGLGFILGPMIGGFLGEFGSRVPFFAAAALGFINFLFVLAMLQESLPREQRRSFEIKSANPLGAVAYLKRIPLVGGIVAALFIITLGQFAVSSTWAFYTIERFAWSPREIGYSLSFIGALMVVVNAYITRIAIPALGNRRTCYAGLAFSLVSYVGYAFAPFGWVMYMAMIPGALSALTLPPLQGIMVSEVPATEQGQLQGAIATANGLAAIISPPIMTQLFSYFSRPTSMIYLPGAPFLLAFLLTLIAMAILVPLLRRSEGGAPQR